MWEGNTVATERCTVALWGEQTGPAGWSEIFRPAGWSEIFRPAECRLYWESVCAGMLYFSIIFTFSVMITSFFLQLKEYHQAPHRPSDFWGFLDSCYDARSSHAFWDQVYTTISMWSIFISFICIILAYLCHALVNTDRRTNIWARHKYEKQYTPCWLPDSSLLWPVKCINLPHFHDKDRKRCTLFVSCLLHDQRM